MGSAFSERVMEEEAKFIDMSIRYILSVGDFTDKFIMIGHSMGGLVNYLATQMPLFPIEKLDGLICLSSPLNGRGP